MKGIIEIRKQSVLTGMLILILLFLMPVVTVTAEEIPTSGQCGAALNWEFDSGSGTLTIRGSGDMTDFGNLYHDDGLDTAPWVIDEYRYKITKLVMEPGVTSIGNHAFQGIPFISEIEMPEGITRIGEKAFFSCTEMTEITIPESVQEIGTAAFFGCRNLQQVTIPAGITEISGQVFSDCVSLKEITIPDGVTRIGSFSFASCEQLTRITIPASVNEIRWNAFEHCDSLSDVQYMGTQEQWKQISIKDHNDDLLRAYLRNKTDVEPAPVPSPAPTQSPAPSSKPLFSHVADFIHNTIRILLPIIIVLALLAIAVYLAALLYSRKQQEKVSAVYNGSEILEKSAGTPAGRISVSDPDSGITMIPDHSCGDHLSWSFDESSGRLVISGYGKMTDYPSISDIPWIKLKIRSLVLEPGVTSVGSRAFADRSELSEVIFPDSLVSIGPEAFMFCKKLKKLSLPENLQVIHNSAFRRCSGLTEVKIPPNIAVLEESVFEGCSGLERVSIPANIKQIHKYTFRNCSNLKSVHFEGTEEQWSALMETQDENSALQKIHF